MNRNRKFSYEKINRIIREVKSINNKNGLKELGGSRKTHLKEGSKIVGKDKKLKSLGLRAYMMNDKL